MVALRNAIDTTTTTGNNSSNTTISSSINSYNESTDSLQIPEYIPSDDKAIIPFSYYDYVIALQAQRRCIQRDDNALEISGLHNYGRNWQVPFMKCDARKCKQLNEDAIQYCEYSFLAIAASTDSDIGGHTRAIQFQQYMYTTWPTLRPVSSNNTNDGSHDSNHASVLPFQFDFVQIFNSERAIEEYVTRNDYGTTNAPKISMGIIFYGNSTTDYKYTIRQNSTNINIPASTVEGNPVSITTPATNRLFNHYAKTDFDTCARSATDPKWGVFDDSCTGLYIYNGVIATQRLVGDFILYDTGATQNGYRVSDGSVSLVQFPQQAFVASGFFTTVEDTAPLLIILGLLYPVASMIGYIVQEKQLRQKELMKMMSVLESDIGWSWFISFASFNIVAAMCAALVSAVLYENSTTFLLSMFWILSFIATTVYCMTMATLTSKSSRAVLIGLLVFFSGVFLTIAVDYEDGSPSVLAILCLHPATTFAYGIKILGHLEDLKIGLVHHTLHYSDGRSNLSMMKILQYLCIDIVFWGFLSWYLNRVIAPDFGQALPFWFPLDINYWLPNWRHRKRNNKDESNKIHNDLHSPPMMRNNYRVPTEPVSDALKAQARLGKSIEIRDLRKVYGETIAVDGLNLSMYCGQITALLGHNGAGKTTTINMLTGATAPTSGHAIVAGNNIRTNMSNIRQDMGICLQHDCLFPQLTVREHVQFFARLKGLYTKVSIEEAEKQVDQALIDVALSEKRNTLSKNLSGGMKRKLSVAIAFCGGSKVVLLDEPTSGMDPFSRRFTWNLIRHYKKDRIIILTTHFMDEADILGDRIAIMAEGQLRCVGSSLFLKKTFGVGYQLTIDRGQDRARRNIDTSDQSLSIESPRVSNAKNGQSIKVNIDQEIELTRIIKDAVRDAVLLSNVGSELSYQLPLNAASSFAPMFTELDEKVDDGSISCYGVSITTLNEVFLMVTRGEIPPTRTSEASTDSDDLESFQTEQENASEDNDIEQSFHSPTELELIKNVESERYFARHVIALMKKRGLYFRRDKKAWICTTIVPSVFVFVGFLIVALTSPKLIMEPLLLNPNDYNTEIGQNQIIFNSPDNPFTCQPGICSHRQPYNVDEETNEQYVFCGYQAKIGVSPKGFKPTNDTCTVLHSSDVMATLESENLVVHGIPVDNLSEVRFITIVWIQLCLIVV
jgi:ATP-binding cassette, subfamily A (ABC1), member 3